MINVIPEYLKDAIEWHNRKFPLDLDVNVTILYGFDCVSANGEEVGAAVYNTDSRAIYLADPEEERKACGLSEEDMKRTALMNLFHEYCHHIQNVNGLPFDEREAEDYALMCYQHFTAEVGA